MKATEHHNTDRLLLIKIDPKEMDAIFSLQSANQKMARLGLTTMDQLKKEELKYSGGLCTHNKKYLYFQMILKDSNEMIGWCGYHTWYVDHRRAEIGYQIFDEKHRNKGLMKEAMVYIVNFGFSTMNLNRIEAFVGLNNTPSLLLMKAFGFQKEGQLKQHYNNTGTLEDSLVFGLLKENYN